MQVMDNAVRIAHELPRPLTSKQVSAKFLQLGEGVSGAWGFRADQHTSYGLTVLRQANAVCCGQGCASAHGYPV